MIQQNKWIRMLRFYGLLIGFVFLYTFLSPYFIKDRKLPDRYATLEQIHTPIRGKVIDFEFTDPGKPSFDAQFGEPPFAVVAYVDSAGAQVAKFRFTEYWNNLRQGDSVTILTVGDRTWIYDDIERKGENSNVDMAYLYRFVFVLLITLGSGIIALLVYKNTYYMSAGALAWLVFSSAPLCMALLDYKQSSYQLDHMEFVQSTVRVEYVEVIREKYIRGSEALFNYAVSFTNTDGQRVVSTTSGSRLVQYQSDMVCYITPDAKFVYTDVPSHGGYAFSIAAFLFWLVLFLIPLGYGTYMKFKKEEPEWSNLEA